MPSDKNWSAAIAVLALGSCQHPNSAQPVKPAILADAAVASPLTIEAPNVDTRKEHPTMGGATSPAGDKHPGQIVHDDKIDGRTFTKQADEVPVTIAWVEVEGIWKPVTRIEITGSRERRSITKFGTNGDMLETTVAAPPPRRH